MSLIIPLSFYNNTNSANPISIGKGIYDVAVYSSTEHYVGGAIETLLSNTVSGVGLLNPLTNPATVDMSFTPAVGGLVRSLSLSSGTGSDRLIFAGGFFTSIDDLSDTQNLAVLNYTETGGVYARNDFFDALPIGGTVHAVLKSDKIYIGGTFTDVGTDSRKGVAAYNLDGTLNSTFRHNIATTNGFVRGFLDDPGDALGIYAYGKFDSITGYSRNSIIKLNKTSGAIRSFNANSVFGKGTLVYDAAIDVTSPFGSSNDLIVMAVGTNVLPENKIVRLSSTGSKITDYYTLIQNDYVSTCEPFSFSFDYNNNLLMFVYDSASISNREGRVYKILNTSTPSIDVTFGSGGYVEVDDLVFKIRTSMSDIYFYGSFQNVSSTSRSFFVKLNTSGIVQ